MRREDVDRVLTSPLAAELLRSRRLMHLAYRGPDGYPRAIPIGYLFDGRAFIVCTADKAPKVDALIADERVALTIDTETQPPRILLVRGIASVEMVEGVPGEYLEASRKYIAPEEWNSFETEVRALYKRMARIRINPEWAKLIDFETTLPIAVEELVHQRSG